MKKNLKRIYSNNIYKIYTNWSGKSKEKKTYYSLQSGKSKNIPPQSQTKHISMFVATKIKEE